MKKGYFINMKTLYDNKTSYFKGFDGDLAYEFTKSRSERMLFDNKRTAKKQLKELNRNNRGCEDVCSFSICKLK